MNKDPGSEGPTLGYPWKGLYPKIIDEPENSEFWILTPGFLFGLIPAKRVSSDLAMMTRFLRSNKQCRRAKLL